MWERLVIVFVLLVASGLMYLLNAQMPWTTKLLTQVPANVKRGMVVALTAVLRVTLGAVGVVAPEGADAWAWAPAAVEGAIGGVVAFLLYDLGKRGTTTPAKTVG